MKPWLKSGDRKHLVWAGKFLRPKVDFTCQNYPNKDCCFEKRNLYYCIAERMVDNGPYGGWGTGLKLLGPNKVLYFDDKHPKLFFEIVENPKLKGK